MEIITKHFLLIKNLNKKIEGSKLVPSHKFYFLFKGREKATVKTQQHKRLQINPFNYECLKCLKIILNLRPNRSCILLWHDNGGSERGNRRTYTPFKTKKKKIAAHSAAPPKPPPPPELSAVESTWDETSFSEKQDFFFILNFLMSFAKTLPRSVVKICYVITHSRKLSFVYRDRSSK